VLDRRTFRHQWKIWGPSAVIVALGFLVAYQFVEPAPPRQLILATGDEDGAYHRFGERYRAILAQESVDLILRPSSGTAENLESLQSETDPVDVAFIQGGVVGETPPAGLEALGSVFLEPLWVFVSERDPLPTRLNQLEGLRLAVGAEGSGTRAMVTQLLRANTITPENADIFSLGGSDGAEALRAPGGYPVPGGLPPGQAGRQPAEGTLDLPHEHPARRSLSAELPLSDHGQACPGRGRSRLEQTA
jgi:hypothetical protein